MARHVQRALPAAYLVRLQIGHGRLASRTCAPARRHKPHGLPGWWSELVLSVQARSCDAVDRDTRTTKLDKCIRCGGWQRKAARTHPHQTKELACESLSPAPVSSPSP